MLMLGGGVFGARALGPGGQARLAEAGDVTFFEKSRVGSKPTKTVGFSGRLARVRAGVYRTLSGCPGWLGPEVRGSRDLFPTPAARPSVHHSCFFRTLDEE